MGIRLVPIYVTFGQGVMVKQMSNFKILKKKCLTLD